MVKTLPVSLFKEVIRWPVVGRGSWHIWMRNFLYFKYTIWISLLWVLVEPLLFFIALGHFLGNLIGPVNGEPYIVFFTPALMAASGMLVSFFEGTFGTYTKLSKQKTYHSILLTPVTVQEIAVGEVAWAASKGFMSVLAVLFVAYFQNLVETWLVLPALAVLFVHCWLIAAFAFVLATSAKHYDWFIYAQTGLIMPMYLFSGTFFPLSELSEPVQNLAYLLPLTHAVEATRTLFNGHWDNSVLIHLGILSAMAFLLTNMAVSRLEKKAIA